MIISHRAAAYFCPSPRHSPTASLFHCSLIKTRPLAAAVSAVDNDQDGSAAAQPGTLWCIAAGSFVQEVQQSFPRVTWQPAQLVKVQSHYAATRLCFFTY